MQDARRRQDSVGSASKVMKDRLGGKSKVALTTFYVFNWAHSFAVVLRPVPGAHWVPVTRRLPSDRISIIWIFCPRFTATPLIFAATFDPR